MVEREEREDVVEAGGREGPGRGEGEVVQGNEGDEGRRAGRVDEGLGGVECLAPVALVAQLADAVQGGPLCGRGW